MPPIALTDAQLTAVFEAARLLAVRDRESVPAGGRRRLPTQAAHQAAVR
jgi:hypothetical protein